MDCVLIVAPPSYRAVIAELGANEMSLKWKPYKINIWNGDQYQPWYMKLNSKMYVPTMIVQDNTSVCESVNIIEYMDENLSSTNSLLYD